jgi:hypothetical protein
MGGGGSLLHDELTHEREAAFLDLTMFTLRRISFLSHAEQDVEVFTMRKPPGN